MPKPVVRKKFTSPHLSKSSRAYLERQAADPYVHRSKVDGYRSRAAYKLKDIHEKYHILKPGQMIADLGCAPGSWSQVAAEICGPTTTIVGIDLLPTDPLAQCTFLQADFSTDEGLALIEAHLPKAREAEANSGDISSSLSLDIVLSDMAANTIGHRASDGLRTMALVEMAADFALKHLRPGGHFITKFFQNGDEAALRDSLRPHFEKMAFFKPPSSRKDSREGFLIAISRKPI